MNAAGRLFYVTFVTIVKWIKQNCLSSMASLIVQNDLGRTVPGDSCQKSQSEPSLETHSGFFAPHWGQKLPVLPAWPLGQVQVSSEAGSVSAAPVSSVPEALSEAGE